MDVIKLTWDDIKGNAVAFSKRWKNGWDEKSEAQSFVRDFLAVFGVSDSAAVGRFEERALRESGKGFMDYFWAKQIAIEMKTKGKDLNKAYEWKFYSRREPKMMPLLLRTGTTYNGLF